LSFEHCLDHGADGQAGEIRQDLALASVEIDIDGVLLVIHGVQAIRVLPMGTRIDLPMFRDESGVWRRAITLPDEICANWQGSAGRARRARFGGQRSRDVSSRISFKNGMADGR
jgi:hypothetical protein